jgi:hypothetical protein
MDMITRREFVIGVAGIAVARTLTGAENTENLVAPCGLYCGACPMYLASQQKDGQKIEALHKQFSSGNMKLAVEDLLCDGCIANGRIASFCRKCGIRDCASKKTKSQRCSECSDFACSRITGFNNDGMLHHAEVLENLRQLRGMGIKEWTKHEAARWSCPQCKSQISWYDAECSKCRTKRSDLLFPLKKA